MRFFQVAYFSVVANALVIKSKAGDNHLPSFSVPTRYAEVPGSTESDFKNCIDIGEEFACQSLYGKREQIVSDGRSDRQNERRFEHALEPEDEDWEANYPYNGPTGNADIQGYEEKHHFRNMMRKGLSKELRTNLENILSDFKSFEPEDSGAYEKYFISKIFYKDIAEALRDLEISINPESDTYKLFKECQDEMDKVQQFSKQRCIENDQKDANCLHFVFRVYEKEIYGFLKGAYLKLRLLETEASELDIAELQIMENRSEELIRIGRTYGGNTEYTADMLYEMGQRLQTAIQRGTH